MNIEHWSRNSEGSHQTVLPFNQDSVSFFRYSLFPSSHGFLGIMHDYSDCTDRWDYYDKFEHVRNCYLKGAN